MHDPTRHGAPSAGHAQTKQKQWGPEPEIELTGPSDVVVPPRVRLDGADLASFTTVPTFGTPLDVTVSELAIELFYPATPETANVLRAPRVSYARRSPARCQSDSPCLGSRPRSSPAPA